MERKLTPYDLKLLHQVDTDWTLSRGRFYSTREYYGKRDRIYYKDGSLWRDTWVHEPPDPLKEAMSFATGNPQILPPKLKCMKYEEKDLRTMLEEAHGPEVLKLPWKEPYVDERTLKTHHIVARNRQTKLREPVTSPMQYGSAVVWKAGANLKYTHKTFRVARIKK